MALSNNNSEQKGYLSDYTFATHTPKFLETAEYPSDTIKCTIRHENNIDNSLRYLELKFPDMEITSEGHIITITGIPPDNDFGERTVLNAVQEYDSSATAVSYGRA